MSEKESANSKNRKIVFSIFFLLVNHSKVDIVSRLIGINDEPFGEGSGINLGGM